LRVHREMYRLAVPQMTKGECLGKKLKAGGGILSPLHYAEDPDEVTLSSACFFPCLVLTTHRSVLYHP